MLKIIVILLFVFVFISFIGLFLVWKLLKYTKKLTNCSEQLLNILQKNDRLLENIEKMNREEQKAKVFSHVFSQALIVRNAVYKQTDDLYFAEIEKAPKTCEIGEQQLKTLFSPRQSEAISKFWALFQEYLQKHWYTREGKLKTVFRSSELEAMQADSKRLIKQLDHLLEKMSEE